MTLDIFKKYVIEILTDEESNKNSLFLLSSVFLHASIRPG